MCVQLIADKTQYCLEKGLSAILCIGESLEERETGKTFEVLPFRPSSPLFIFPSLNLLTCLPDFSTLERQCSASKAQENDISMHALSPHSTVL